MQKIILDRTDKALLKLLQADAGLSLSALADAVKLSSTPCWRRIQRMEAAGVIRKRVALVDAAAINLDVTVFVSIKTNQHNSEWLEKFAKVVARIPEVMEVYRMSGDIDYLLRVVVPDIPGYDKVYRKLIREVDLFDVSSSFAMEQMKYTTALPLDYA